MDVSSSPDSTINHLNQNAKRSSALSRAGKTALPDARTSSALSTANACAPSSSSTSLPDTTTKKTAPVDSSRASCAKGIKDILRCTQTGHTACRISLQRHASTTTTMRSHSNLTTLIKSGLCTSHRLSQYLLNSACKKQTRTSSLKF